MKVFLIAVLFIAGCSFAPKYDNNEYGMLIDIQIQIEDVANTCENEALNARYLKKLHRTTRTFDLYSEHLPQSEDIHTISSIIDNDVKQFLKFNKDNNHNPAYCIRKTTLMHKKVEALIPIIAKTRK